MWKRRTTWFGGTGALLLVLALSGIVAAAPALAEDPAADPVVVDTTETFEDLDGNGVDDDCQDEAVVADPAAAAAAALALDVDADGVISTTEAAHSELTGGANCNHGGYVSWIAQAGGTDAEAAKAEKLAAAAVRAALKAERTLARETAKAERTAAHEAAKAERTAARDAAKAERAAARDAKQAERHAAKAARKGS